MEDSSGHTQDQILSRRAFLRRVFAFTGVSAGASLLTACETAPATSVSPVAQQPTPLPPTLAPTAAAPVGAAATLTAGAPASTAPTAGRATTTPATNPSTSVRPTVGAASSATPRIVAATNAFLATLESNQKSSAVFDWSNTAQKQRWSNLPQGAFQRAGVMWGDLSQAQQQAWLAVMQVTLSAEGYNRVMAEWNADDALAAQQGGGGGGMLIFGKKYYWIAIIGIPSATSPWQWQWGGHHVTINATIAGPNIALTPSFIGVQPATYTDANGATVRPLGDITDEAFTLVNSLDATQQKAAILGPSYVDLVLGPGQDGKTIQTEGLPASQMTATQKAALLKLAGHYTGLANETTAVARMAEITSTLDQIYFAWYGPTAQGSVAYFRITGPTLVIEFSPQQLGGNPADH